MKWENFDKKVKKELVDHQTEVDLAALWGAIEPEVNAINADKKKRRRGAFWWFVGGLLLIGMMAGLLFAYKNNDQTVADANIETLNTVTKKDAEFNKNKKESTETTAAVSLEKTKETVFEKATGKITNQQKSRPLDAENTTVKTIIPKPDISKNQQSLTAKKLNGNNIFNSNQPPIENGKLLDGMAIASKKSVENVNDNLLIVEKKESNEVAINTATPEATPTILKKADKNTLLPLLTDFALINGATTTHLQRKPMTEEAEEIFINKKKEVIAGQRKPAKKKVNFAMSTYGGIGLSNRNLMEKNDSLDKDLRQLREDTERSLETISLGLQLHLQHKKTGIELTTGINYTQINERFDYNKVIVEVDSIEGVEFVYRNINGDTIETMGMLPRTTTTTFTNRHYNKYRLIDVPILVGYRKQLGKISIGGQAGVFVNLKLKTSGLSLNTSSEFVELSDTDIYKSSIGLSYYLGATIDYQLTEKWSIIAAPYVRHLPNNIAKSTYGLEQKYTLYGVNVGVRYGF